MINTLRQFSPNFTEVILCKFMGLPTQETKWRDVIETPEIKQFDDSKVSLRVKNSALTNEKFLFHIKFSKNTSKLWIK